MRYVILHSFQMKWSILWYYGVRAGLLWHWLVHRLLDLIRSWTIVLSEGLWCNGWVGDSVRRDVCWTVGWSTLRSAVWRDCFVLQGSERLLGELCLGFVLWLIEWKTLLWIEWGNVGYEFKVGLIVNVQNIMWSRV